MKKLLLLFFLSSNVIFSQQVTSRPDTLFKSHFQISNQLISKDKDGRLYLAFTGQSGNNPSSKEIFYAVQESDSFVVNKVTSNFSEDITSSLFISQDNKLHIIFLSRDSENLMQLYYMNNAAGKFSKRIQLTKTPVSKIAPKAVMDRLGMIHIIYFTNSFADNQICYKAFSTNNFSVSNDIVLCEGQTDNDNDADITIDSQDKIHLVVKSGSIEKGKLKYFSNTTGLIKETDLNITDNICSPKLIFSGKILNIFYKNTDDQRLYWISKKRDFSSPTPVTPEIHNPIGIRNCCIDESERIYLVYQNFESSDLKNIYMIYFHSEKYSAPANICSINDNSIMSDISLIADRDGITSLLLSSNLRKDLNTSGNLIYAKNYLFGNAIVKTSCDTIHFGEQFINETYNKSIRIFNEGSTVLKLYSPSISHNSFGVETFDTLFVLPDSSADLNVSFSPSDLLNYNSKLVLYTNAINYKTLNLKLFGSGLGYPEISTGKDTIFIFNPKEFADSILIMNTGTTTLSIDSVTASNPDIQLESLQVFLEPGDSLYITVTLNSRKRANVVSPADTICIYSNDHYADLKYIIVQSISISETADEEVENASNYELLQNYPNPFNPSTTISFVISQAAYISLAVYDALAREIAELADGYFPAGTHTVPFTAVDLSTGIYYYKLRVKSGGKKVPDYVEVRKMMLIK